MPVVAPLTVDCLSQMHMHPATCVVQASAGAKDLLGHFRTHSYANLCTCIMSGIHSLLEARCGRNRAESYA